jgi:hypothetical protein
VKLQHTAEGLRLAFALDGPLKWLIAILCLTGGFVAGSWFAGTFGELFRITFYFTAGLTVGTIVGWWRP